MVASVAELEQGYRRTTIISGLNLEVPVGALGLLGPNGAGKTTLLRTLATALPPRGGTLTVLGERVIDEASARRARRNIGFLPQGFDYPPDFTVRDFVEYAAWLRQVPRAEARAQVEAALSAVDMLRLQKKRMKSLSGGMVQRTGLASALVGRPRLLLLDEPTTGLDPAQRLAFRNLIRSLDGVAVVVSTHLVEDVEAMCDRVAVLDGGRLLFTGSPVELGKKAPDDAAGDSPLERGYLTTIGGQEMAR